MEEPRNTSQMIARQERQVRGGRPAVCILVENNPAPLDRRVWQEARALNNAGYRVSVISPKGLGLNASRETIDGIEIYRHRTWEAQQPLGYLVEYIGAFTCEFLLALRVYARTRFQVIHACNPPDNIFLIGAFFKLFGVRFIFDHHDLCPELFEDKFGKRGFLYRLVCLSERLTFRTADISIATNESYRDIALTRGRMSPKHVFIVRSCLDLNEVHRRPPKPELKNGRQYLVVYLGVNGSTGRSALIAGFDRFIVHRDQRRDAQFVLIGYGPELERLKGLATQKGLDDFVTFTGAKFNEDLEDYLSTADVAVAPDPAKGLNDKSTMNKILHYMAYGLPIVQYDLTEGRRSAGDAALYAGNDDPKEFALQITSLLTPNPCVSKSEAAAGSASRNA